MFERRTEEFKAKIRNDASFKSMLYEEFPMLKRLYHNEKAILAENGLHNKLSINMAVFLQFVREMIAQGYNWFGLDSLGDLIPNLNTITRNELNEFLDIITKAQVTFIVIHHPNGKSGFRGSKDIPSVFDSAYMLEEITRLTPKGDAILKVNVLKDRFGGEEDFFVKREYVNDDVAKHKIISADEVAQFQKKAK
ncbi:hypothetical protein AGMMS49546_16730 [Spirochaetia bacterium]|nr:hypothetical protein AGMMS49546_16730 [Spirochaetia bacterium]